MFRIGSVASGMGMHLHGIIQEGGVTSWAIECDEEIAQCYRMNHAGRLYVKRVQDIDVDDLSDIDCLVATPSCKTASVANKSVETPEDFSMGQAIAQIIRAKLPKVFLLENVWKYRTYRAFAQIEKVLAECGYYFRYYHLNCADWGVAQSRSRLYGVAVHSGAFWDIVPPGVKKMGWYEVIADIIEDLPETKLADWQLRTFPELSQTCIIPDQSKTKLVLSNNPALTVMAGHQTIKALIKRAGGGRDNDRIYSPSEPAFTIRALGRKNGYHSRVADAVIGDRVVAVIPRACLRFFGDKETADNIWLPDKKSLAQEVVGNGASWVMFRELIKLTGVFNATR